MSIKYKVIYLNDFGKLSYTYVLKKYMDNLINFRGLEVNV